MFKGAGPLSSPTSFARISNGAKGINITIWCGAGKVADEGCHFLSLSTPRTCDTANYKKRRGLGAGKRGACWTAGEKWTEKKKRGKTWKCQVRLLLWEHQSFYKFQQQQRRRLLPSILPFRDVRSALLRPTLSPTLFASIVVMTQRPSCPFLSTCHR